MYRLMAKGVEAGGCYHLEYPYPPVETRRLSHVVVEAARALVEEVGTWLFDGCP